MTGLSVCVSILLLKIPLADEIRVGAASYLTPPISFSPASVSLLLMNINAPSRGEPLISGLIKPAPSDSLWLDRLCSLESVCSPHVRVRRRRRSTLWSITIRSYLGEGKWAGHWCAHAVHMDNSGWKCHVRKMPLQQSVFPFQHIQWQSGIIWVCHFMGGAPFLQNLHCFCIQDGEMLL